MKSTNLRDKEDILSKFLMESEKDQENMNDMYLRQKHPLIQQKIADEVKTATEADDDTSIDEFGVKLTDVALDTMHYLYAVISETLRLKPAVPLDGKSAVEDDILLID